MKRLLMIGLGLVLLHGGDALACSCSRDKSPLPEQVANAYRKSDFVAEVEIVSTATVTEAREVSGERWSEKDRQWQPHTEPQTREFTLMQVNILKLWKGSPDVRAIATGLGGGDCGLPFSAGEKVLVYGHSTDTRDRVSTGNCTRTRSLDKAAEDIKILEEIR